MKEKMSPAEARSWLEDLGIDEESWGSVMEEHPSVSMATGHELKAAVTIARGDEPKDFGKIYQKMRELFPQ